MAETFEAKCPDCEAIFRSPNDRDAAQFLQHHREISHGRGPELQVLPEGLVFERQLEPFRNRLQVLEGKLKEHLRGRLTLAEMVRPMNERHDEKPPASSIVQELIQIKEALSLVAKQVDDLLN